MRLRRKALALAAIALLGTAALFVTGSQLWDVGVEHADRRALEKDLHGMASARNMASARQVQEKLAGRDNFSFVVFGDTHQNFVLFKRLIDASSSHRPDFIVHIGYFANDGHFDEYLNTIEFLNTLDIPAILTAGNHDIYRFSCTRLS